MKGIDVSKYQGKIDFEKVKAGGVEVVIMKATEGKAIVDRMFETNYTNAKKAGLKIGVYHFLRANNTIDEVNNLLRAIHGKSFDCKIVIDMETDFGGIEINSNKTRAFADALISKGYEVALYSGEYFYNNKLNHTVKDLPLWVAKYSRNQPKVRSYIGWQYTSSGSVNGISSRVDMDDFNDGILLNKNGQSQPTPKDNSQNNSKPQINQRVLTYQKAFNKMSLGTLVEDGLLGPLTLASINKIPLIKIGSNNGMVGFVQGVVGAAVDNIFGNETLTKLKDYQSKHGLASDGIAGKITITYMIKN